MQKKLSKDFLKKFGANLKEIRESKGLSQSRLASIAQIDNSHIAKIEKGQKNITILTVAELAEALDVKPRKLLDFD